jgi:DNA-binding MarR family transcriptional regulator
MVALPDALADHACFLLGTLAERAVSLFGQTQNLSVRASGILLLLNADGPTSQHALGQQLRLEHSTLSLAADELEQAEPGTRRHNPADRRQNQLQRPERGRTAAAAVRAAAMATEKTLMGTLDDAEQEQLRSLLRRLL